MYCFARWYAWYVRVSVFLDLLCSANNQFQFYSRHPKFCLSFYSFYTVGAEHLRDSEILISILEKQKAAGKLYAAICAAPAVVLASHGLLDDIEGATCYPAEPFRQKLVNPVDDAVAVTGNVITSKGPGTSLAFALEVGEQLFGKEIGDKIQKEMLIQR
ncbi:MAG: transcriptional regulator GlxA family with amidase domain [Bacillariaceae sp.]